MIEPVNVPILLDVEEAEEYAAQIGSLITISEVYGGLPSGGNAGEILIKNSDEDYDAIWGNINFPTEVFYATYGVTTADEIKAARQAGKTIFLNYNGRIYGLSRFNEGVLTSYEFTAILGRTSYSAYLENSVWSQSSKQLVPIETIGLLHDLNTTDKSSIVNAINEVEAGKLETEYFDFTWDGDHNPVPATGVTSTNIKSAVQAGKLVFARVLIGDMDYPIIFSLTGCYDTYIQFNAFESNIIFDELTCSIMPDGNSNLIDLWNARYSVLPAASNNTPQNLGVAAVGSSDAFARADHVHAMPSAIDVGAIAAPSSPSSGDVLTYSNNAWVAAAPSSGISDYSDLSNKPQINSVTLSGNKSLADLGITPDVFYATYGTTTSTEIEAAYQAGKAVYCIQELLPGEYYCFSLWYKYGSAFHQFVAAEGNVVHFAICDSDSWSELYTSCYSKPSSGIPKSDLASAVQTSLGKADTALQPENVDDSFSTTSENPIQNKVLANAFNQASQQLTNLGLALDDKVDKVSGKGLSTNDFTNDDKDKLDGAATESWVQQQEYLTANDLSDYRPAAAQDIIDAAQDSAIAAIKGIYWCIYGTTTNSEIQAALDNGFLPVALRGNNCYTYDGYTDSQGHSFIRSTLTDLYRIYCKDNVWYAGSLGIPLLSSATPKALGTASAGSANRSSKADHVHPMPSAADIGAIAAPANPSSAQDLVYLNGAWVAADKVYIVNCTPTALDFSGTMDKTVAEIYAAYQAGKTIMFRVWGSASEFADVTATMVGTNDNYNYPSFNAFIIMDGYNVIAYAYTGTTDNGSKATYHTIIYPISTSACIPAPATPTTGDFLCWNGSSWAATSLSTWQGGNY